MMSDEGEKTKAQYWTIPEFPQDLSILLWGERSARESVALNLTLESASQSSYWKDNKIKAYNPFKTSNFSASWGTGEFTCTHTMNDKAGAWWRADIMETQEDEDFTVTRV